MSNMFLSSSCSLPTMLLCDVFLLVAVGTRGMWICPVINRETGRRPGELPDGPDKAIKSGVVPSSKHATEDNKYFYFYQIH